MSKIQTLAATAADAGTFQKQIERFVADARQLAEDGLTLAEIGELAGEFLNLAVVAASTLRDATGEEKKAAVLEAFGYLLSLIGPAIPLPLFLAPFRAWILPGLRAAALAIASGLVEVFVARLPDPQPPPAAAIAA